MTDKTSGNSDLQQRSEGYWLSVWRRVRRNRRGMVGLFFVALMLAVWIFSPLLATNQPIVCKYEGKWYFPAVIEIVQVHHVCAHRGVHVRRSARDERGASCP